MNMQSYDQMYGFGI